jgi:hypothetical protein
LGKKWAKLTKKSGMVFCWKCLPDRCRHHQLSARRRASCGARCLVGAAPSPRWFFAGR